MSDSTIRLTGIDALNFYNVIHKPSHENIIHFKEKIDAINESVTIRKISGGYEAEIDGLKLGKYESI